MPMKDQNPNQPRQGILSSVRSEPASIEPQQDLSKWQRDQLVVLSTFENAPEAHCLRMELESNGIRAAVSNELSAQTIGASLFGRISAIWIEVLVLKSDAERALQIKRGYLSKTKASEIPEWTCKCGATVDAGFAQCWSCLATFPTVE